MNPSSPSNTLPTVRPVNRCGRLGRAGAFGYLGTLKPPAIGYVRVRKLDPFGVLFRSGVSMMVARSGAGVAAAAPRIRGELMRVGQRPREDLGSAT